MLKSSSWVCGLGGRGRALSPTHRRGRWRWIVGDGEVAVQFAERVGEDVCSSVKVGPAGAEDDVDELSDPAAVLFAGDVQGGDGSIPLVFGERSVVDEGAGEVSDGLADVVEAERCVHQKLHPVVGRVAGSSPTPS